MSERVIEERTVEPGGSASFGARFNATTGLPRLEVKILAPDHVKNLVECKDDLLGKQEEPDKAYRVFRVHNRSTWPVFLTFVERSED